VRGVVLSSLVCRFLHRSATIMSPYADPSYTTLSSTSQARKDGSPMRVNLPCKDYKDAYNTPTSGVSKRSLMNPSQRTLTVRISATRLAVYLSPSNHRSSLPLCRNPSPDSGQHWYLFTLHVRPVAEDAESGENPSRGVIGRL